MRVRTCCRDVLGHVQTRRVYLFAQLAVRHIHVCTQSADKASRQPSAVPSAHYICVHVLLLQPFPSYVADILARSRAVMIPWCVKVVTASHKRSHLTECTQRRCNVLRWQRLLSHPQPIYSSAFIEGALYLSESRSPIPIESKLGYRNIYAIRPLRQ